MFPATKTNKIDVELSCDDGKVINYVWPSLTSGKDHVDVYKRSVHPTNIVGFIQVVGDDRDAALLIEACHEFLVKDVTETRLFYYAVDPNEIK